MEKNFKRFWLGLQSAVILQSYLHRRRNFVVKYELLARTICKIYYAKKLKIKEEKEVWYNRASFLHADCRENFLAIFFVKFS